MAMLFKIFMTLSSLLLTVAVYLTNKKITLSDIACQLNLHMLSQKLANVPEVTSYLFYIFISIAITYISLFLIRYLPDEQTPKNDVAGIEPANDSFLPSYLGYFFVALSTTNLSVFIYTFSIIFIFVFFSRISFFNPVLFIFRYKFFYISTVSGQKTLLITRKKLKAPLAYDIKSKRINDYTFIDMESNK